MHCENEAGCGKVLADVNFAVAMRHLIQYMRDRREDVKNEEEIVRNEAQQWHINLF